MEIFSAQGLEHKEFSVLEFSSEMAALPLLNELPTHVKIIDMFSLLNGRLVALVSCNNLKKTYEELRNHRAVVDGYFTNDTNIESLRALYYLNKVNISESLFVVETSSFAKLFELLDIAYRHQVGVLDIKNQRSFEKNTIYFTADHTVILNFEKAISKQSNVTFQMLKKVSESLRDFFGK